VLSNVRCRYIEAENCVLINVTADRIIAKPHAIIYNLLDEVGTGVIEVEEKEVLVGVFDNDGKQTIIRSHMDIDGGKAWETKVAGNTLSFEEVYNSNAEACPTTLERVIVASHGIVWNSLKK
jgi:hypothetical protein